MKYIYYILGLILLLPVVSADVLLNPSTGLIKYFPLVVIVEIITFWLFSKYVFKIDVGILKSIIIVLVANIITTLLGSFILDYGYIAFNQINLLLIVLTLILTLLVEYLVITLFFIKKDVKKSNLFWITCIINIIGIVILAIIPI